MREEVSSDKRTGRRRGGRSGMTVLRGARGEAHGSGGREAPHWNTPLQARHLGRGRPSVSCCYEL